MFDFLKRVNLQFFAADNGGDGASGTDGNQDPNNDPGGQQGTNGTGDNTPPEDEKTFTQQDVNNIATKEARNAQEKVFKELGIEDFESAKEGMAKFREWQESQKTDAEKQKEKYTNLEKDHASISAENNSLKAQISAMKAGVNGESVEDVVALAERLVTDEVDMDSAINEVITKYPHFAKEAEPEEDEEKSKPTFSTGKHVSSGSSPQDPFAARLAKYKK